jgi:hypothetical protein
MNKNKLCVACAAKKQQMLEIRDGLWQYAPCPGCKTLDVLWPIMPLSTDHQPRSKPNQGATQPSS